MGSMCGQCFGVSTWMSGCETGLGVVDVVARSRKGCEGAESLGKVRRSERHCGLRPSHFGWALLLCVDGLLTSSPPQTSQQEGACILAPRPVRFLQTLQSGEFVVNREQHRRAARKLVAEVLYNHLWSLLEFAPDRDSNYITFQNRRDHHVLTAATAVLDEDNDKTQITISDTNAILQEIENLSITINWRDGSSDLYTKDGHQATFGLDVFDNAF